MDQNTIKHRPPLAQSQIWVFPACRLCPKAYQEKLARIWAKRIASIIIPLLSYRAEHHSSETHLTPHCISYNPPTFTMIPKNKENRVNAFEK